MDKGHVFLAQNSETDYVTQAYALALSIKTHNKNNKTCIITNDPIPNECLDVFDHVIKIPWGDNAKGSMWKIENRWKIIYVTPFKENIVYDTDMLILSSNDHWWDHLSNFDVCLTSKVTTYRNQIVNDDYYRKAFTDNMLPNVYMGVHYFKKTKFAYEFYKWLEIITNNYEYFYAKYVSKSKQRFCSMDLNASLALLFMDAIERTTSAYGPMSFTHMKPAIQGWVSTSTNRWQDELSVYFSKDGLKIGNFLQTGIFHYTEDDFLTKGIIKQLEIMYVR